MEGVALPSAGRREPSGQPAPTYLIDTDWLIDALIGISSAVALIDRVSGEGAAVSVVSHCELLEGVYGSRRRSPSSPALHDFLARFETLPISPPVVDWFARTRAQLRSQGRLLPDFDLVIAATALAHNLTLVTRNRRHFGRIEGLRLLPEP